MTDEKVKATIDELRKLLGRAREIPAPGAPAVDWNEHHARVLEFESAAVNALPALLDHCDALQAERDKLADLLADRSTELDWERSGRQAAEAERDKLSGEVERLKGVLAGQTQAFNEAANNHLASEANRQALAAAYEQGCIDTHKAIQSEPELALMSVEHAEFGEAASDYAAAFQSRKEEKQP